MPEQSSLIIAQWATTTCEQAQAGVFMRDVAELPMCLDHLSVVLEQGTETRANELLAMGVGRVLLADAALRDSNAIGRLAQQYGAKRVGVWLPVEKRKVSWALDYVSNEDFRCLAPSIGKAGWEVLLSDGGTTGTDAEWWVGEMLKQGAGTALISVDMQDDDDLNICAGLMENHGAKLWFTPRQHPNADLEPWVRYGHVRQLVLLAGDYRDEAEIARLRAATRADDALVADAPSVEREIEQATV